MIRTTPFHERLSAWNDQGLFTHWQGYLSPLRYTHAPKHEYFAVRNAVGLFDTSPLFKYVVRGPDAERLLSRVLVRDVRACAPGEAQYTAWCDERGYVMDDGVVLRHSPDELWLTTARPTMGWLLDHRGRLQAEVEDVSDEYGILALQGPRSRAVLAGLTGIADEVTSLAFFTHRRATIAGAEVTVSRTGFTGDLGFELVVPATSALDVLDAVLAAGRPHALRPYGEEAMDTLRIEAGLPLVDVEWHNGRLALSEADCVTPRELGLGWMLRGLAEDDRRFVGSEAVRGEPRDATSRWATTGVVVDWLGWDSLHREAGLFPAKNERRVPYESVLHAPEGVRPTGDPVGYVTSLCYSPVLQRHVGIARVEPGLAAPGTALRLEISLEHRTTTVGATTTRTPFFNSPRKVARP